MWSIELDPATRVLSLRLVHQVTATQMRALSRAHSQALGAALAETFRVFADLRGLAPLDSEALAVFAEVRRTASTHAGYRGRAVLTDGATVAMQQRRIALEDAASIAASELITGELAEARTFLARPA